MKNIRSFKALALAAVVAGSMLLAGCHAQGAELIEVKTAPAATKTIDSSVDIAGTLLPQASVNIAAKISGRVKTADFAVGETVTAGQTLVQLDTAEINAQVKAAKANYNNLAETLAGQRKQAQIPLNTTAEDLARTKALFIAGAVSEQQLDQAQAAYDSAKAKYEAIGDAGLAQAKAQVESAEVQLANTTIISPINGVIVTKNINAGELASPGVTLVAVADISNLKLKGTVSQQVFPYLQQGEAVQISLDAFADQSFNGIISLLGPISVGSGAYFPIELTLANPGNITAGLSARSTIMLQSTTGLAVPKEAVIKEGGETYVFVIAAGVAHKTAVQTGLSNAQDIMISAGLKAGDEVAVTNANILSDNLPVAASAR